jgi:hypothetical protein
VTVSKEGFKRAVTPSVVLDVDQKARVDFTLEIGQVSQTLEVTAAASLVRSESAELGEVVAQRQVQDLPLNGRNFAQLVDLVPGVTAGQPGENLSGSSSFNPRAASDFNALGSQANTNAWLVDGIDDNEWTFNTVMVQPSVESIAEFKVLTGTFSAEFGRGAGVVSVSTRSGSNEFHGEATCGMARSMWSRPICLVSCRLVTSVLVRSAKPRRVCGLSKRQQCSPNSTSTTSLENLRKLPV